MRKYSIVSVNIPTRKKIFLGGNSIIDNSFVIEAGEWDMRRRK